MTMEIPNSLDASIPTLIEQGQERPRAEHKTNLDAADFQKLFLEQLKHQDPMEPMNQQDMMNQLATLMELSRNNESNELLKSMNEMAGVRNRMESGSLIGKHVSIDTRKVDLRGGIADIKYNLPTDASMVKIDIFKGTELVRSIDHDLKNYSKPEQAELRNSIKAKFLDSGVHSQLWNGTGEDGKSLADGTYTIMVRAADAKDHMPMRGAAASMEGWIKAVNLSNNQVTYKVGNSPTPESTENAMVKPEQITEILPN